MTQWCRADRTGGLCAVSYDRDRGRDEPSYRTAPAGLRP